jgi:hypothetical protein
MEQHHATAILPCNDLVVSTVFYEKLGFALTSDHGHYRILADGKGWHLHLNQAVTGWLVPGHNPFGIYLYTDDVDGVADRVRELIIEKEGPSLKPWGCYEFAVSDPDGTLVRVGRVAG